MEKQIAEVLKKYILPSQIERALPEVMAIINGEQPEVVIRGRNEKDDEVIELALKAYHEAVSHNVLVAVKNIWGAGWGLTEAKEYVDKNFKKTV